MKKKTRFLSVLLAVFLLFSAVPFSFSAAESYVDRFEGFIDDEGGMIEFIPEESGWYGFYSVSNGDAYGYLYDEEFNEIAYGDDTYTDFNFYIKAYLSAGKTYYLEVYDYAAYEGEEIWIEVYVEETVVAMDATILYEPEDKTVIEGAEYETVNLDELVVEFGLSDGSKETWSYWHDNTVANSVVFWGFALDENDEILVEDGKVILWINCDDAYLELEFEVVENPAESFEVDAEPIVLYENYDGVLDEDTGIFYYWYQFGMEDTVTVHYKDGTSVTDKVMFFADDYGCQVDTYDTQDTEPWKAGKDNFFYATYLGFEIKVPVEIVPIPVKNVELTKLPDKTAYESCYEPLWQGAEVTLTLKDGSKVSKTINEDDLMYNAYLDEYTLEVGGFEVYIYLWNEGYEIACFDLVNTIEGFTFIEPKAIADRTVVQASETGEGTIIDVVYEDGEKETFEFDVMDYWDPMDISFGRIKTEHGYTDYTIEPAYEGEEIIGYDIWFLNDYVFAELDKMISLPEDDFCFAGDADENGTVNIKDATAIQKHTAGIITLSDKGGKLADVDVSGSVNVKDATAIQKWIAGIETGLSIGDYVN